MCVKADQFCSDGVTRCDGGCRGHGMLRESGKPYRKFSNIQPSAVPCQPCAGTGLRVCGCTEVTTDKMSDAVALAYRLVAAVVDRNRKAAEARSRLAVSFAAMDADAA